jgi:hypothetical protein
LGINSPYWYLPSTQESPFSFRSGVVSGNSRGSLRASWSHHQENWAAQKGCRGTKPRKLNWPM